MLHHIMNRDNAGMGQPGRGPRLSYRSGDQLGMLCADCGGSRTSLTATQST